MLEIGRSIDRSVRSKLREFARLLREDEEVRARVRRVLMDAYTDVAREVEETGGEVSRWKMEGFTR